MRNIGFVDLPRLAWFVRGPHGAGVFKDVRETDPAKRFKMFIAANDTDVVEYLAVALKTGTDDTPIEAAQNSQEKLTPKWTPFLTPTAYSGYHRSAMVGNEQDNLQENDENVNCLDGGKLDTENDRLATVGTGASEMGRGGFEPPTHGFSVQLSGNRRL